MNIRTILNYNQSRKDIMKVLLSYKTRGLSLMEIYAHVNIPVRHISDILTDLQIEGYINAVSDLEATRFIIARLD